MFEKKSSSEVPPADLPGRNDPCRCGSGKKYKKCCEDKDAAAKHVLLEKQWTAAEKAAAKQAEEEKAKTAAAGHPKATPKPSQQPHVAAHRHNTITTPKFNMPRRTGGG